MNLNKQAPIFLGVCWKYSKEFGISVDTLRIITAIAAFFCSPVAFLYIALGVLDARPDLVQEKPAKETREKKDASDDEVIVNGVRGEQAVVNDVREY